MVKNDMLNKEATKSMNLEFGLDKLVEKNKCG